MFGKPKAEERFPKRLPAGPGIAAQIQLLRQFSANEAKPCAGTGFTIVDPQPPPVGPGLAKVGPEPGQGSKSGKGATTALAFDSPTYFSINLSTVSLANTFRRSNPSVRAKSIAF